MKDLFYQLRYFLVTSFIFIGLGGFFLFWTNKVDSHLTINQSHTPFQDIFFKYYTYVGDGVFVAITTLIISILLYKKEKIKLFFLGGLTLLSTGLIVQVLKRLVFDNAYRPVKFLSDYNLYHVPGVDLHFSNSFPSGHSAAGFAFFAFIAFISRKSPVIQLCCALAAVLVGYSRIYLSQHFLEDTVFGAIIGIFCFVLSYAILYPKYFKSK